MMTEHQERLISLLLGTFPNFQSGDSEAALTAYAVVITDADPRDVEPGIMRLIKGEMPGFDGRFAPTATQLARSIRMALDHRVDQEIKARKALPPPEDAWKEPTPEQRARGRAILANLQKTLSAQQEADDAANEQARKAIFARTNARFDNGASRYQRIPNVESFNVADDDQYDMGRERVA